MLFVFHPIFKTRKQLRWLDIRLANAGTWVRFPGPLSYFMIFSITCFHAALHPRFTIRLHLLACHICMMIHLKAMDGGPPCTSVNAHAHALESQTGFLMQWAKNAPKNLLYGPDTPMVCIMFTFYLIFLLILLIVFNCFL